MNRAKYIVLSSGRAGTNFLTNNLHAHPNVFQVYEPFHNEAKHRTKAGNDKWEVGTSSAAFLYDKVFHAPGADIKAAGSKLFYFHARQDIVSADVWGRLRDDKSIKIIFLNRRNFLNKHLSDLRADAKGLWHPGSEEQSKKYIEQTSFSVDIGRTKQVIAELYASYHLVKEQFRSHEYLEYFFEDLEDGDTKMIANVFNFLNLDPIPLKLTFKKGTLSPETTIILNGTELKNAIGISCYSEYLETCDVLK